MYTPVSPVNIQISVDPYLHIKRNLFYTKIPTISVSRWWEELRSVEKTQFPVAAVTQISASTPVNSDGGSGSSKSCKS